MAFTAAEKSNLRRYLGIPLTASDQYTDVTSRIAQIEGVAANEDTVRVILTALALLETQLNGGGAWRRQKIKGVDNISLAGMDEIKALRSEGRRLSAVLATTMDLVAHGFPLYGGAFGSGAGTGQVSFS